MKTARLIEAAEDPRSSPWWAFVGIGTAAAVAVLLVHFNFLLVAVFFVGVFLGVLTTYRRSAYSTSEEVRSKLAARAPLPGTIWPVVVSAGLVSTAINAASGSWGDVPLWGVIVTAVVTGTIVVPLLRKAELSRIAGLIDLESELAPKGRVIDPDPSATE